MGALCSKPGTLQGGHKIIGTTQRLGGDGAGGNDSIPVNARQAALDAAERRKKTVRVSLVVWCGVAAAMATGTRGTDGDD